MNLFPHQITGIEKGRAQSTAFFWEMGTGKTICALNVIPSTPGLSIILCPISVLTSWQRDAELARPDLRLFSTIGFAGNSRGEIRGYAIRAAAKRPTALVINYEQAGETAKHLKAERIRLKAAICDESSYIKNMRAQRTKAALALRELAARGYVLSGTPVTQGFLDLFAQMKFVDAGIFTENFWGFRARYARMGGFKNKQVVGYRDVDKLVARIKPWSISLRKEDVCRDLPPKIFMERVVELSDAERAAYDQVKRDCIMNLPQGQVPLVNALAVVAKLTQAACGFLYFNEGNEKKALIFGNSKRAEALRLLTDGELSGVPTVIWSIYTFEGDQMAQELRDAGVKVLHPEKRIEPVEAARRFIDGAADVLVANPASLGYGVNLQRATAEIFLSNTYKYGDREQAEARCHRIGQAFPVSIIDVIANRTGDRRILNIIKKKAKISDYLSEELGVKIKLEGEV